VGPVAWFAATVPRVERAATIVGEGCRLVVRVTGYERPAEKSGSDANWLKGDVELLAGRTGSFRATHGVALRTEELQRFRDELRKTVESLTGVAILGHIEGQVGCRVELAKGRGTLTAFVREEIGSELQVQDCETDQSYLSQTLRELDAVLKAFPARGTGW